MPVYLSHCTYLRIPKAASSWVTHCLRCCCEGSVKQEGVHGWEVKVGAFFPSRPVFTYVREPRAWLRSRWGMGRRDASDQSALYEFSDRWCPDLGEFLGRVSDSEVAEYFKRWTERADYVLSVETLPGSLADILEKLGQPFDRPKLLRQPRQNVTDYSGSEPWAAPRRVVP